ncbi:hypothetical protein NKH77_05530 [Streptomyces sp. M19]
MTSHAVPPTQRAIVQRRYGAARDVLALSEAFPVHAREFGRCGFTYGRRRSTPSTGR